MGLVRKFQLYRRRYKTALHSWIEYLIQYFKYSNPGRPGKEIVVAVDDIKMAINDRGLSRSSEEYRAIYRSHTSIIEGEFWGHVKDIDHSNLKLLGFRERFIEGREWKDTSLFKEYGKVLSEEGKVQGCRSIKELVGLYEQEHDALYDNLRRYGVRSSRNDLSITPIYIYIYKDGSFIFTSGGNHRLNMAKVLGLKSIPVRIKGRHVEWQKIRDEYYELGVKEFARKYPMLAGHPDF